MASAVSNKPAPPARGHRRTVSTDIIERARLEVLVPDSTDLDIYEHLNEHGDTSAAAALKASKTTSSSKRNDVIPSLASVTQRQALFYDEDVPVYIALQIIGIQDDAVYESYSSRLAVSLEVTAIENAIVKKQDASGPKHVETPVLLFQKTIQDKDSGRISWRSGDVRIAVWKLMVPLGHPKVKTANPKVVFSASATLRFLNQVKSLPEDEYITSRQTTGVNLLETFSSTLSSTENGASVSPYLSAARVSRVTPSTPTPKETFSPLGYSSKKQFPILPALNFKMRGSKLPRPKGQDLIACLHLEVTSYAGCEVRIDDVALNHPDGKATIVTGSTALSLPLTLQATDEIMFLFSLATPITPHHATPSPSTSPNKQVSLKLRAEVSISDVCRPAILTHWDTTIDFSSPSQLSSAAGNQNVHRGTPRGPTIAVPNARPITPNTQVQQLSKGGAHDLNGEDLPGLSITFTGPPRVRVGELFSWQVFVVNRSNRSRKLALIVPPKRRKGDGKVLPNPPQGMTEPILDESVLYTTYKVQYLEPAELVPLVNDVKIGPLAPNACHNAELRFMALATGVLHVEGIRVVDLATNEITDCRDLPSVICVGK